MKFIRTDINWIVLHNELKLSEKDKLQPKLKDAIDIFKYGE